MGSLRSSPITSKDVANADIGGIRYGLGSMQGWRSTMEDAYYARVVRDGSTVALSCATSHFSSANGLRNPKPKEEERVAVGDNAMDTSNGHVATTGEEKTANGDDNAMDANSGLLDPATTTGEEETANGNSMDTEEEATSSSSSPTTTTTNRRPGKGKKNRKKAAKKQPSKAAHVDKKAKLGLSPEDVLALHRNHSAFAVFDGHCGWEAAEFAAHNWYEIMSSTRAYAEGNVGQAMRETYLQLDNALKNAEACLPFMLRAEAQRKFNEKAHGDDKEKKREGAPFKEAEEEENGEETTKMLLPDLDALELETRARMGAANIQNGKCMEEALSLAEIMVELQVKAAQRQREIAKRRKETDKAPDPAYADFGGCTAVAAVLYGRRLTVANAGDSRAVICRVGGKAEAISEDHRPQLPRESERILAAGETVSSDRVSGRLAMSRALGDFDFKANKALPAEKQAVTADPDIFECTLKDGDEFLVVACDGIWDALSNDEVVSFVRTRLRADTPISAVISDLFDKCMAAPSNRGTDNMTCIIVEFKPEMWQ